MTAGCAWESVRRVATLLALAAFLLYLPTLFHGFFADDDIYLAFRNNPLRDTPWSEVHLFLTQRTNPWEYLPLRDLSYWLDFSLYKTEGMGFHVSNLIWYALSALGFGLLVHQLILFFRPAWSDRATALAWCGTALFLVHPAHVEAVAWVASRKDLMSGSFAFFSGFALVHGMRSRRYLRGGLIAAVLLLMASFSKAAGVTIVLFQAALILTSWRTPGDTPTPIKLFVVLLLLCTAAVAASVHTHMGASTGIRIENTLSSAETFERASRILAALQGLIWFPSSLGIYHDVYALSSWHWAISGTSLLCAVLAMLQLVLRPTLWACGIVLLLAPCTVYLQMMPYTTWSLASERFVFMSVGGAALILIDLFGRMQPRAILMPLLGIFMACAVAAWERIGDWEYSTVLLEKEYARLPAFHNAIRDHIDILQARGDAASMAEAERLARTVKRPYATEALLAQLATARSYRLLGNWRESEDAATLDNFCRDIVALHRALAAGREAMRREPDVSYNNLLSSIETDIKQRYPDLEQACQTDRASGAEKSSTPTSRRR